MKTKKLIPVLVSLALGLSSCLVLAEDNQSSEDLSLLDAIKNGKPMTSFRLRYDYKDQDGYASAGKPYVSSNAFTLRSLVGWQTAPFHSFSVGAQLIGVTDFNSDFNTKQWNRTTPDKPYNALIQDPNYYNINQLYIDWTGLPSTKVRVGQQSLKLDNVRFIGNVEFRQVMQVFTGTTIENSSIKDLDLMGGYYTRLRKATTSQELSEDTGILHANYHLSPTENLTGYAYWYDTNGDTFAVTGLGTNLKNLSNRTLGVRLDGSHPVNQEWKLLYTAEYAKQDHIAGGYDQIDAHYYKLGLGGSWNGWFARFDQELLSSNNGQYGFYTPLGTNHLFQGWIDKFAASTPKEGMRDSYITAGGKWQDITLLTEYHRFDSEKGFVSGSGTGNHYGTEWDISAGYAVSKQLIAKVEYGKFREGDNYGTPTSTTRYGSTDELWLTALYTFN
jgi:hypothetical protein